MAAKPRQIDPGRLPVMRAGGQLLHRPPHFSHPADVARAIGGAQAQDEKAGRLAFRARSRTITAADVDRAFAEERSLVRTWVMRGTMHYLAADDVPWLVPLYEDAAVRWGTRRLAQLGIEKRAQERALDEISKALQPGEPVTRNELAARIERRKVALNPSTRIHVFRLATMRRIACQGPNIGGRPTLVREDAWLGPRPPHDGDAALKELARRYLSAFAPATEADFAGWAGLGLEQIRSALAGIAKELRAVRIGNETAFTLAGGARSPRGRMVRLLPAWDTYLMGHRDRDFLLEPTHWKTAMPGGGIIRATILVDGVVRGTWRLKRSGKKIGVELEPFEKLDPATTKALAAEVADVGRFEGYGSRR